MGARALILIVAPVALIACAMVVARVQANAARAGLVEAEAIEWTLDGEPVRLKAERTRDGELEHFALTFNVGGRRIHDMQFSIDHDLFGGGLVGGLDVDGDGTTELILATRAGRASSFLVRPERDGIVERPLSELPDETWQPIASRLETIAPGSVTLLATSIGLLWLLIGVLIYLLIGTWSLSRRLLARARGPADDA